MRLLLFLFPLWLFAADMNETLVSDYNATLNANQLALTYSDYNFLMGLSGLLVGFVFMAVTLFLVVNIAKGR